MPDRFTLDPPGDSYRNSRSRAEREGPECECHFFGGDQMDASECPLHGTWTDAERHKMNGTCFHRQRIIEWADTVDELREAMRTHERECPICSDGAAFGWKEAA